MKAVRFNSVKNCFSKFIRNWSTKPVKELQETAKAKVPTIEIEEVTKFSKRNEIWWNTSGPMRGLHLLNTVRVQFVREGLASTGHKETNPSKPLEGVSIIDIGCGGGILSEALAKFGADTTGVDPSEELINCAKMHASLDPSLNKRLNYIQTSVEELASSKTKTFDAVVASEVLEHVPDQESFLKNCSEILKPGGSIFITTINRNVTSWLIAIIAWEYIFRVIPVGTHDWNKFITPIETERLLEKCNCETKLIRGFMYNPLKRDWYWSSSDSVHYALHAVKKLN